MSAWSTASKSKRAIRATKAKMAAAGAAGPARAWGVVPKAKPTKWDTVPDSTWVNDTNPNYNMCMVDGVPMKWFDPPQLTPPDGKPLELMAVWLMDYLDPNNYKLAKFICLVERRYVSAVKFDPRYKDFYRVLRARSNVICVVTTINKPVLKTNNRAVREIGGGLLFDSIEECTAYTAKNCDGSTCVHVYTNGWIETVSFDFRDTYFSHSPF